MGGWWNFAQTTVANWNKLQKIVRRRDDYLKDVREASAITYVDNCRLFFSFGQFEWRERCNEMIQLFQRFI